MTASDFERIADALIENPDVVDNDYFMSDLCEVLGNSKYFNRDTFEKYITAGIDKAEALSDMYPTDEMVKEIEGR
tara:strand:- start:7104 stop:7328 length:225 start_codon:yes stop_codon:yes gene_type:complete